MHPSTYRRVIVKYSDPNPETALAIVETPMTDPAPHELLVHNHYAGVNYSDISHMMGLTESGEHPPFDFGLEAIGEVVAIGSKVEEFAIGDCVVTMLPGSGYREYGRIAANLAVKVPDIHPEYVGLFVSGAAAKIALDHVAEIRKGEVLVITAPFTGSGHMAVQLASRAGAEVIAASNAEDDIAILKELGASRIVDRSHSSFGEALREYSNRINVVYDALGGAVLDECLKHIAPRGRVVLADALREHISNDSSIHQINLYRSLINKSVTIKGINLSDYARQIRNAGWKMFEMYKRGEIRSMVDPTPFIGVESVPDAIRHAIAVKGRGKILIQLSGA
jgi:hypothetical protein